LYGKIAEVEQSKFSVPLFRKLIALERPLSAFPGAVETLEQIYRSGADLSEEDVHSYYTVLLQRNMAAAMAILRERVEKGGEDPRWIKLLTSRLKSLSGKLPYTDAEWVAILQINPKHASGLLKSISAIDKKRTASIIGQLMKEQELSLGAIEWWITTCKGKPTKEQWERTLQRVIEDRGSHKLFCRAIEECYKRTESWQARYPLLEGAAEFLKSCDLSKLDNAQQEQLAYVLPTLLKDWEKGDGEYRKRVYPLLLVLAQVGLAVPPLFLLRNFPTGEEGKELASDMEKLGLPFSDGTKSWPEVLLDGDDLLFVEAAIHVCDELSKEEQKRVAPLLFSKAVKLGGNFFIQEDELLVKLINVCKEVDEIQNADQAFCFHLMASAHSRSVVPKMGFSTEKIEDPFLKTVAGSGRSSREMVSLAAFLLAFDSATEWIGGSVVAKELSPSRALQLPFSPEDAVTLVKSGALPPFPQNLLDAAELPEEAERQLKTLQSKLLASWQGSSETYQKEAYPLLLYLSCLRISLEVKRGKFCLETCKKLSGLRMRV
jgi:hypothetical protein